jgi:hypothetical protein
MSDVHSKIRKLLKGAKKDSWTLHEFLGRVVRKGLQDSLLLQSDKERRDKHKVQSRKKILQAINGVYNVGEKELGAKVSVFVQSACGMTIPAHHQEFFDIKPTRGCLGER